MGTYLRDKFFRLKARRGYKRAVVAVAHTNPSRHLSHVFPPGVLQRTWRSLPGRAQ